MAEKIKIQYDLVESVFLKEEPIGHKWRFDRSTDAKKTQEFISEKEAIKAYIEKKLVWT